MSELINNARQKKDLLKHMILQLHEGVAPQEVKVQLARLMGRVPYNDVVEVEQELISEGLPQEEVLRLCDIHTLALKGQIEPEQPADVPPGHPVHTFREENKALERVIAQLENSYNDAASLAENAPGEERIGQMRFHFASLCDVEKHYKRKENLLFPYLEKHGITGPPTVMWGKHDETREFLKGAIEALEGAKGISAGELDALIKIIFRPASEAVKEMIYKEENILLPMCLDKLTEEEWYHIYRQSLEIGFCLYDPTMPWHPAKIDIKAEEVSATGRIQLPSGSFTIAELTQLLNTIPFDLTFVDKDDTVRFFTQGQERIFARNRAILGRQVQLCHPPSSVHIVQKIIDDFRTGKQNRAAFWINMHGKFISIEYFALRDEAGEYLGVLEVSQDLTAKRALQGEQRLLNHGE